MNVKSLVSSRLFSLIVFASFGLLSCEVAADAQEKRTIFTENDFHWQAKLAAGQTLEVINRNGGIDGTAAADNTADLNATKRGRDGDEKEAFIEVVEYSDGVTVCAIYAKEAKPGRCHRGGVDNDSGWHWHDTHVKIDFNVKVPKGVLFKAETTNGSIHARNLNSIVDAYSTNGSVEVSTSEWASGHTTNGHVDISMGKADWTGELDLATTNGGISVSLPGSATFKLKAETTNGGIHTDFPITVMGSFASKSISGTVGAGGRDLKLETTNGGIELRKSGS